MVLSTENSNSDHDMLITQKQIKLSFPHFPPHSMPTSLEDPTSSGRCHASGKRLLHPSTRGQKNPGGYISRPGTLGWDSQFPRAPKHLQTRWPPITSSDTQSGQDRPADQKCCYMSSRGLQSSSAAAQSQLYFKVQTHCLHSNLYALTYFHSAPCSHTMAMTIFGTVPRDNVFILLGRYLLWRPKCRLSQQP